MADDTESEAEVDDEDAETGSWTTERSTAPQSDYTAGNVVTGVVVAAIGVLVTFGVPLLLG